MNINSERLQAVSERTQPLAAFKYVQELRSQDNLARSDIERSASSIALNRNGVVAVSATLLGASYAAMPMAAAAPMALPVVAGVTALSALGMAAGVLMSIRASQLRDQAQWKSDGDLVANDLKANRSIWDKAVDFVMRRDDVTQGVQAILAQQEAELVQHHRQRQPQPVVQHQVEAVDEDDQSAVRVERERG